MVKQEEPSKAVYLDTNGNEVPEGSPFAARRLIDREGNYDAEVARFYGLPEDPSERKVKALQKEALEPLAPPDAVDGDAGDEQQPPPGPRPLKSDGGRRP